MTKFLSILAALSLTAFFSESSLAPLNGVSALSIDRHDLSARRSHGAISKAKKSKRGQSKRCKSRPTSSSLDATAPTPNVNIDTPASSSSDAPAESKPTKDSNSGGNGGSGDGETSSKTSSSAESKPTKDSNSGSNGGDSGDSSSTKTSSSAESKPTKDTSNDGDSSGDINKAGINWFESGDKLDLWKPASGKEGWMYNWTPEFPGGSHDGWEFVPMLWGNKFATDNWWDQISNSGSKYVMSINEPDQTGQANMDAGALVDIYKKYMTPLHDQGYKLGLPATSSAPVGFTLIQDMLKQCGDACPYDFVPVHWYDVDFDNFKDYVGSWHDEFAKPVWVTEFACQNFNGGAQCDEGKIWWFMTQATFWMDNTDWIDRYCAFGTMKDMTNVNVLNRLMDPSSLGPNALGKLYLNLHLTL